MLDSGLRTALQTGARTCLFLSYLMAFGAVAGSVAVLITTIQNQQLVNIGVVSLQSLLICMTVLLCMSKPASVTNLTVVGRRASMRVHFAWCSPVVDFQDSGCHRMCIWLLTAVHAAALCSVCLWYYHCAAHARVK